MPHLLILVSSEKHKKNNLEKFCNFPDSLLLTSTCNYAVTKCNFYFLISDFLCHPKGMKEIFCEIFRLFLFLSIKQAHAYESIKITLFHLATWNLWFLVSSSRYRKIIFKSFGFLLLLSWKKVCASSIYQKSCSYIFQLRCFYLRLYLSSRGYEMNNLR